MTTPSANSQPSGDLFQNSIYIGMGVQNVLYGIELYLYVKTMHVLLANGGARNKTNLFYAIFSSMMLFLVTIWVVTQSILDQKMWLLEPGYPGGPYVYWAENSPRWYVDFGTVAIFILQLMTDALMIYRCWIIWNSYRVVAIPILLWLAALVYGIVVNWTIFSLRGSSVNGIATKIALEFTISMILNLTLTCLICYRMVRHARMIQQGIGDEYASLYFAVVAVVVESVLPYTLSGIVYLVTLATGSFTSIAFAYVYFLMMCISPQMLILRVAGGRAQGRDTTRHPSSTIKFSAGSTFISQRFDSSGTRTPVQTLSDVYLPDQPSNSPV